jgi:methyl-accepting chemotaxis protein
MISAAVERTIEMVHQIFEAVTGQAGESEKIVATMQQVRELSTAIRDVAESARG